jgi:hypothetical protein
MLGLILTNEQVTWTDEGGATRSGVVVALTDDELWAEVLELGQDDVVQLPTSLLHPIK